MAAPNPNQSEDILFDIIESTFNITDPLLLVSQYECFVDVLKVVSQKHGLDYLWQLNDKSFARNIAVWKKCGPYETAKGLL